MLNISKDIALLKKRKKTLLLLRTESCTQAAKIKELVMKLKQKITLFAVLLCAVPLIISAILTNSIANKQATIALKEIAEQRLVSLRDVKKQQIEDYFSTINNQLLSLANSKLISTAVVDFSRASKNYAFETNQLDRKQITNQLLRYYDNDFTQHYMDKNLGAPDITSSQLLSDLDINALAMQNTFIAQNKALLGEKDSLTDPKDGSQYGLYHAKYHPYLRDFLNRFGFYDIFLVDASSGKIVYSVYKELDYATSLSQGAYASSGIGQAFKAAMNASQNDFVSIADFSPYTPSYEDPASFMATPIFDNGIKKGILIFQMPVDRINQIMTFGGDWTKAGLGDSGETYLVGSDMRSRSESRFLVEDKAGYIAALKKNNTISSDTINIIETKNTALGLQPVESLGSKAALSGTEGFNIFPDYRGVSVLSAYSPLDIKGLNWIILAEIDETEAFAPANQLSNSLWISGLSILIIMILLAAGFAFKFSGLLANPILEISNFITHIATKLDLTERIKMDREDEIGDAASALNNLLQTFQQGMNEVADASYQIAAASEQTSVITASSSQAIQAQQTEITAIVTAMNGLIATVSEISKNTTDTSSASNEANGHVDTGSKSMAETINLIQELATTIEKSSRVVGDLAQRSSDISTVLEVINGIAEQTNLLALNAAIEAARAGEHGRGFSVVADEVRTLASRTKDSTSEISTMIELLQQGSKEAVTSMDQSTNHAEQAVSQANETGEAFSTIEEVIYRINNMSTQIATSAKEQGIVSEDINQNIVRINEITEQTAEGAAQTSIASDDLARLASGLNTLVQRFKVQ